MGILGCPDCCCVSKKPCQIFEAKLFPEDECCSAPDAECIPVYNRGTYWFHNSATVTFNCRKIQELYKPEDNIGIYAYGSVTPYDSPDDLNSEQERSDGDVLEQKKIIQAGNLTVILSTKRTWHYDEDNDRWYTVTECKVTVNGRVLCQSSTSSSGYVDTSSEGHDELILNSGYPTVSILKKKGGTEAYYQGIYIGSFNAQSITYQFTASYTGTDKYLRAEGIHAVWTIPDSVWTYENLTKLDKQSILSANDIEQYIREGKEKKKTNKGCAAPTKILPVNLVADNLPVYSLSESSKGACITSYTRKESYNWNQAIKEWPPCPLCCSSGSSRRSINAACKIGTWSLKRECVPNCDESGVPEPCVPVDQSGDLLGRLVLTTSTPGILRANNFCLDIPYSAIYTFKWENSHLLPINNVRLLAEPEYGSATVEPYGRYLDADKTRYESGYKLVYKAPGRLPAGVCTTQLSYEMTGNFGEKSVGTITFRHYKPSEDDQEPQTEYNLISDGSPTDDYEPVAGVCISGEMGNTILGLSGNRWTINLYKVGDENHYHYIKNATFTDCLVMNNNFIWDEDPDTYYRNLFPKNWDHPEDWQRLIRDYKEKVSRLKGIIVREVQMQPFDLSLATCSDITEVTNAASLCSNRNVKELIVTVKTNHIQKHVEFTETEVIDYNTYKRISFDRDEEEEITHTEELDTYTIAITKDSNPSMSFSSGNYSTSINVLLGWGSYSVPAESGHTQLNSTQDSRTDYEYDGGQISKIIHTSTGSYDDLYFTHMITDAQVVWEE